MGHIRVDLPNTNNKWVGFELVNVDTFIICVGFELANVDTIRTLTRPIDMNCHPYKIIDFVICNTKKELDPPAISALHAGNSMTN